MKKLITAAEIRAFAKTPEKMMSVEPGTIITPAAWDEARECGITIETNPDRSGMKAEKPTTESGRIDPEFLARVVGEVIACLQKTEQKKTEPFDLDPSGMKRIRSERMVFSHSAADESGDRIKTCELFGPTEGAKFSTRILTLTETSFPRKMKVDETWHVLEGRLECSVNGTCFAGTAGDSFFFPALQTITLSVPEQAKVFAVAAPVR